MWKYICTACMLLGHVYAKAQTVTENHFHGTWYVIRWETENGILDFEDTLASFNSMVERFKQKHNIKKVLGTDSNSIRQRIRKLMPAAGALRFSLILNKDKTFIWQSNNNDTAARYRGTYSVNSNTQEIILTSLDGRTKSYQTMPLKLHAVHASELVIEIPSEEPGFKQSKFTLKRM